MVKKYLTSKCCKTMELDFGKVLNFLVDVVPEGLQLVNSCERVARVCLKSETCNPGVNGCGSQYRRKLEEVAGYLFCVFLSGQFSWVQFSALTQCFLWMKSCMSKHKIWLCSNCSQIYQSQWNKFMFSKQAQLATHTHTQKINGAFWVCVFA